MKIKLLFLALCFALASCWSPDKVEPTTDPEDGNFNFEIPKEFKWENFQTINSKITIYNRYDTPVEYGVKIYDGEDVIDAGITKNGVYESSFIARKGLKNVSVVQKDPAGYIARVYVNVENSTINYDFNTIFGPVGRSGADEPQSRATEFSAPAAPAIPNNAIEITNGMDLADNGVYKISAGSVIDDLNLDFVGDVEIYIEGECILKNGLCPTGNYKNHSIYVLEGGKFTANNRIYCDDGKNLKIVNYGEFKTTGGEASMIHMSGSILNAGTFTIGSNATAELYLFAETPFENYGEFKASRLGFRCGTSLKNYGSIELNKDVFCEYNWSKNGKYQSFNLLENRGSFIAKGQIQLTEGAKFENYGHFESKIRINFHNYFTAGEVVINPQSLIKAQDIGLQKSKFISNGDAIIKVGKSLNVDYSSEFVGNDTTPSVIWAPDGYSNVYFANVKNVTGKWILDPDPNIWGAVWNGDVLLGDVGYAIEDTDYNEEGYNSDKFIEIPEVLETIEFATTPKIVAFEDNYPNNGDFDFNDVVMEWKLRGEKDADDVVKELYLDVKIKACGASREIGAGVKIHSLPSNISSASTESGYHFGNYFTPENGIEKYKDGVVVPLFENIRDVFGLKEKEFANVTNNETQTREYSNISVKLEFDSEIKSTDLNVGNFDFFVTTKIDDAGRTEVHTFGNSVTSVANNKLGFNNPQSVWGLELPKDFLHPVESCNIMTSYPQFQNWVTSNGTGSLDWYESPKTPIINYVVSNNKEANSDKE